LPEVYVFRARVSRLGRGALGIHIPKRVAKHVEHLHGREVVVVVITPLD
jgi:antitoxin component of MazEF toxin-antitoxin module